MKKYKSLIITIVVFLVLIFTFFIVKDTIKSEKFSNFIKINEGKTTKISIKNGSNGTCTSTDDKVKIKEFIILLNDGRYKKSSNQNDIIGYNFFYIFYVGNKEVLKVIDNENKIKVNGIYYDVTGRNFRGIKNLCNSLI